MTWVLPSNVSSAKPQLVCFPFAGGSPAAFRTWQRGLGPLEVRAVQLPGRGARLRERPFVRLRELARAACDGLIPQLSAPFAFFGHSFGAIVAFEVARELRRRGGPAPFHLFVSGRRGPRQPDPAPPMHGLSDDQLVAEVQRRYSGIPAAVAQEPELLALVLPALRADLEALETYEYEPELALDVPISAMGGLGDPWATLPELQGWRHETSRGFDVARYPGGHFYFDASEAQLLAALSGRAPGASVSAASA